MSIKNKISITFLSLCTLGCVSQKPDELKPFVNGRSVATIELSNNKSDYKMEPINMSEFVDSVKFIVLEETEECLIKSPYKIFFTPEQVIAVDRDLATIFFFDWNGKYIKKISRKGRGAGEYVSMASCMFDEQKQELLVYDMLAKKILFYDLSGNYLRDIPQFSDGVFINDIINLPNGHFLCYKYNDVGKADEKYTGLWEVDAEGQFLSNYFSYKVVLPFVHGAPHFQQIQNGVISLRDNTHNDLYHYHDGVVERYISYNIKGSKLPEQIGVTMALENKNIRASRSEEKGNYIVTLWVDEANQILFSLFSKRTKTVRYWDGYYSYDANIPGVMHYSITSNSSDILVCYLGKEDIDKHLANQNLPESTRSTLERQLKKMEKSENPVLELLYIKQ